MAEDNFKTYFSEKIWEMIPAIYRHEDGLAKNPDVLRSIVEVMAEQAANVRRSHERLWEDQFIELCNDWTVPYIADLVGTRLVSALNTRARKVDVAKTIYYRRRKGTLTVLEELISDISGWEGQVIEGFRRLARTRHGLDPMPSAYAGRFTSTLPGGTADLRSTHAAEMGHSAFDEFYHTPDLRKPKGIDGLYGIQRLLFYIYRLRAFPIESVSPYAIEGTDGMGFTFDPSGRDIPLYMPRNRPHYATNSDSHNDWGKWRSSYEWELPAPMRCRLLDHAEYRIEDSDIIELVEDGIFTEAQADELRSVVDMTFSTEQQLIDVLSGLASSATFLDVNNYMALSTYALIDKCGKSALYPSALLVSKDNVDITNSEMISGNLDSWETHVVNKLVQVDPENGRLLFIGTVPDDVPDTVSVDYHYGFSTEIGACSYDLDIDNTYVISKEHTGGGEITAANLDNNGVTLITDSATYGPIGNKASVSNMVFISANQQRPYINLQGNWSLDTGAYEDAELILDGLWLGSDVGADIILVGDYEQVTLSHLTIDPGGPIAIESAPDAPANDLPTIKLIVRAHIELLLIDSSIIGPLHIEDAGYIEKIIIRDSIIQSRDSAVAALALADAELHMDRVTVIGDIQAQCLWASDSLIYGTGDILNTQCGCFRFSAAMQPSRLPRQYRPAWIENRPALFTTTRFGDPAYMQLHECAPESITRGAENGAEMGAYNQLINPIKMDGLKTKVEEYMPFGLLPVYIFET